ncbi:hypothetical protein QAD02_008249 [Eretmocerus hayati]|uniref:Uncharacterized protein n=1 Tax=Eretmocerus hayati TaxID=131215 RepID=A0ACC2N606_9HYME|nr:hypothetical protein QAD02_008249 [Eretmocerus hayati]
MNVNQNAADDQLNIAIQGSGIHSLQLGNSNTSISTAHSEANHMEVHHLSTQTNTVDHQLSIDSQESRVLSPQTGNSNTSISTADSGANHMVMQKPIKREEAPKEYQTISVEEFTEALKEMYHYGF